MGGCSVLQSANEIDRPCLVGRCVNTSLGIGGRDDASPASVSAGELMNCVVMIWYTPWHANTMVRIAATDWVGLCFPHTIAARRGVYDEGVRIVEERRMKSETQKSRNIYILTHSVFHLPVYSYEYFSRQIL